MSTVKAIKDLESAISSIPWVKSLKTTRQDAGGTFTVYLLPAAADIQRNVSGIKCHIYAFTLRLAIAGPSANSTTLFQKMSDLETAIERDRSRNGHARDTWTDESWTPTEEEIKQGFVSFDLIIYMKVST